MQRQEADELLFRAGSAGDSDALDAYRELDSRLRAGGQFPRAWTHHEEVVDRLPDGSPGTTVTRALRIPEPLEIPEHGRH